MMIQHGRSFNDTNSKSAPLSLEFEPLSDAEAAEALAPIIRMSSEKSLNSKRECSRIFCDLCDDSQMLDFIVNNGCVPIIANLACEDDEDVKRNAIFSLCSLAATRKDNAIVRYLLIYLFISLNLTVCLCV